MAAPDDKETYSGYVKGAVFFLFNRERAKIGQGLNHGEESGCGYAGAVKVFASGEIWQMLHFV